MFFGMIVSRSISVSYVELNVELVESIEIDRNETCETVGERNCEMLKLEISISLMTTLILLA